MKFKNLINKAFIKHIKSDGKMKRKLPKEEFSIRKELTESNSLSSKTEYVFEKKKPYDCTICSFSFVSKKKLRFHMNLTHGAENKVSCSICQKVFKEQLNLDNHIKRKKCKGPNTKEFDEVFQNGMKSFKCLQCDITLTTKTGMEMHIATLHEGRKPHECSFCDVSFPQSAQLKRHIVSKHEG